MAIITAGRLHQLAPLANPSLLASLSIQLVQHAADYGVEDEQAVASFLGQAAYETAAFTRMEENLHYGDPSRIGLIWPALKDRAVALAGKPVEIANAAYANRLGNGDEASHDGWNFRGRGLFMVSGRANYEAAGEAVDMDLIGNPDLVAQPAGAVLTALWFWQHNGCAKAAASGNVGAVTQIIVGPSMMGLAQRESLTVKALEIFT